VDLYFLALEEIDSIKGEAFNIGGGLDNSLSLLELFDYLNQKLDIELKINRQDTRESDQKVFIADLTKIKSKIDWIPKISLNEGLDNQIKWQEQKN
jgi:CDP-paratose 2-epimerase